MLLEANVKMTRQEILVVCSALKTAITVYKGDNTEKLELLKKLSDAINYPRLYKEDLK